MELLKFAELGSTIFAIAAMAYVVIYVVKIFCGIIQNDMHHKTETDQKLCESNQKLSDTIEELLRYLKFNNNRK